MKITAPDKGTVSSSERVSQSDQARHEAEAFKQYFISYILKALDDQGVPLRKRATKLAELTGKTYATALAWVKKESMPDLDVARTIIFRLQLDCEEALGINIERRAEGDQTATPLAARGIQWASLARPTPRMAQLGIALSDHPDALVLMVAETDEMADEIRKGEVFGVDQRRTAISGSGIYVLERDGRMLVRRVAERVADSSVTLLCDKPGYIPEQVPCTPEGQLHDITVLGQVVCVVKRV